MADADTPSLPRPEALPTALATALVDASELGLCVVQDGVICYANEAACRLAGRPLADLIGTSESLLIAPDDRPRAEIAMQRRLAGKTGRWGEMNCLRADGTLYRARVQGRLLEFEGRPAVLVTLIDISELHTAVQRAEWNAQMLARTETLARTGSMEVEWPSGRVRLSSGLCTLVGCAGSADTPHTLETLPWIPADEREYVAGIWRAAERGEPFEFQHRVLAADGRRLTVLHRGAMLEGGARGQIGVALLQDITAQCEAEQRIQTLANQDEVTGLSNRSALLDHVEASLLAAGWDERRVALLTLDVPQIELVKTSMGFGAGDALVMTLAARLRENSADPTAVGRIGETEFAIVLELPAEQDDAALLRDATALLDRLCTPVRLGATDLFPQCLAGAAVFPRDADKPTSLLEAAQAARLDATPDQRIALFRPEINQRAMRAMQIEGELRQAVADGLFTLHYQPQVELMEGTVRGAEALLRWTSPTLGPMSPAEFIPIAERCGLAAPIGEWVMRHVCADMRRWQAMGLPAVRVGVNLSPAELHQPDFPARVQRLLLQQGIDPTLLSLELTEGMVMADIDRAAQVLHDLKTLGVEIALDDFGTGFSSLSYLSRLPIDVVKVDRSFVHDVTAAVEEVSVTRAVINLAHDLQMQVLAEGVETEGQLTLLSSYGCDMMQGYLFARPAPAEVFEQLLAEGRRVPPALLANRRRERTLLVVDDEENIVAALKRLLRRDGYRIITAYSGEEGLRRLAEQHVDVVLSDQRMPGMTGVEFLNRTKALYPETIRMVLSGYTELQSILDAINEGAIYKFLTKPWDDERLRAHVQEAFRQKGLADENRRLAQQVEATNAELAHVNQRLAQLLDQQREHADMLAASAGSMRLLVEELPAPVAAVDPDGQIVFVNREATEHLPGASAWLGRHVDDAWPAALADVTRDDTRSECSVELEGQRFAVTPRPLARDQALPSLLLMFHPLS